MHELGVVFYVVKDVKKVAEENHVEKVSAVTLEIGQIEAVTFCEECQKEYPTVEHGKICPYCGSENTYLLRGNEFLIKEIEVSD